MPQAAIAPAIGALGSLGGAYLSSRGNNRALAAQERARIEALNWEKARYNDEQRRIQRNDWFERQQYMDKMARRNALLSRYGANIGQFMGGR